MTKDTRSELLDDLENLRGAQLALTDRLRRLLMAMALSEDAVSDVYERLHVMDDPPNGYRDAAAVATEAAQTYRQFLSRFADEVDHA